MHIATVLIELSLRRRWERWLWYVRYHFCHEPGRAALAPVLTLCYGLQDMGHVMQAQQQLLKAIESGDAAGLKAALAEGGDPNMRINGFPVLHVAAINGETELVDALLRAGADANAVDEKAGCSAVMYLAFLNCRPEQSDSLKRLLDAGADANLRHGTGGHTALDMAGDWLNERSGAILVNAGAVATGRAAQRWAQKFQGRLGQGRG
ncbi:Ankyrin repeats (3 copies) [Phycisphaerae bacterium RAS1]|nr:Ankyrin repeats (3 copies) [Phycisphaerae bacterium RAS1]